MDFADPPGAVADDRVPWAGPIRTLKSVNTRGEPVKPENLYPYLVPGLPFPALASAAVPIGHEVWAILFEDTEGEGGIVRATVSEDQLQAAGLSPEQAHRIALENLTRFADESPALTIQMLGSPGGPVNMLLYSDHARAAACLRLPDLYEDAREHLQADDLCACVPQRESLVIFPKRDRAYREMLVGKLREIEADAQRPISFALFELTPTGPRPFTDG